ncbi:MAG: hypothetical protein SX243_24905 [Acidobacteriota bacterium]|nr:hypothetical protein [Acidobacteriota bacterium]
MAEPYDSLAPMPLRILVDQAMRETRKHFRRLYLPFATVLMVVQGGAIFALLAWSQYMESGAVADFDEFGAVMVGGCGGIGLLFVLVYWTLIAMQVAAVQAVANRPIDLAQAWLFPLRPKVIGTLLLMVLFLVLGTLACVFPVIWVAIVLSLVLPVMVLEDLYGNNAIKRSYRLITYNPHRSLLHNPQVKVGLIFVVSWALSSLVGLLLKTPFQLVLAVLAFRDAASTGVEAVETMGTGTLEMVLSGLGEAAGALGNAAVQLYTFIAITLLYFDCAGAGRERISIRPWTSWEPHGSPT